jgi:hypothetical protein
VLLIMKGYCITAAKKFAADAELVIDNGSH